MQDNGAYEFTSVCNVVFKGMEMAGSFTENTAKVFLRICKAMMAIGQWGLKKSRDHQYNKSGKKSQKVMKDKFQGDVLYGKIESVQATLKKQEGNNKNFSEEQLSKFPDAKWQETRFGQLAKKHGLEYCVIHGMSGEDPSLFIQYPKVQESIYQEVIAELQMGIRKECEEVFREIDRENEKKCEAEVKECKEEIKDKEKGLEEAKKQLRSHRKIGDKVGEEKCGEMIGKLQAELEQLKERLKGLIEKWNIARKQTGKDLMETMTDPSKEAVNGKVERQITAMQFLEQSGLLAATDEEFDREMTKAYPEEYAEIKKELSPDAKAEDEAYSNGIEAQKKKKEFVRRVNQNTRAEARKKGTVLEFQVNAENYVKNSGKNASFPHPDYPEFMVTVSTESICGMVDDSKVRTNRAGKKRGRFSMSVYKDADLEFKVPVLDSITGKHMRGKDGKPEFVKMKMTYGEFDMLVKETGMTAAVAMKKKQQEMGTSMKEAVKMGAARQKGMGNAKK